MTGQGLWPATLASLRGLLSSAWAVKSGMALQGLLAMHLRTIFGVFVDREGGMFSVAGCSNS